MIEINVIKNQEREGSPAQEYAIFSQCCSHSAGLSYLPPCLSMFTQSYNTAA